MRKRLAAVAAAVALAFAVIFAGATAASADAFMRPPRSGAATPHVNAGWEAKCTFGSSGYILMRVKGVVDERAGGWYITAKGLEIWNFHETATINVTDEYLAVPDLGGDPYAVSDNSADVNYYLGPNGDWHEPTWFDTGYVVDSSAWLYHSSQKAWVDKDNPGGFAVPKWRVRFKIGGSSYGCEVKTLPTNRAF